MKLKIYTLDLGWEGSAVAIAQDKIKAAKLMKAERGQYWKPSFIEEIEEHEITDGFAFANLGDI